MSRAEDLCRVVDEYNRTHDRWADDGANTPYPTNEYWDSFDAMAREFQAGEIPAECRALSVVVHELMTQRSIFDAQHSPHPQEDFWHARENVARERRTTALRKPKRQTIEELDAEGVSHSQIAQEWGLVDANGTPQANLVGRELMQPGSVIGPDYVHPLDRELERQEKEARSNFHQVAAYQEEMQDATSGTETSYDLWLLGQGQTGTPVSLSQASKMLGVPEGQIEEEWAEFDVLKERRKKEKAMESAGIDPAKFEEKEENDLSVVEVERYGEELAGMANDEIKAEIKERGGRLPSGKDNRERLLGILQQARESQETANAN